MSPIKYSILICYCNPVKHSIDIQVSHKGAKPASSKDVSAPIQVEHTGLKSPFQTKPKSCEGKL